MDFLNENAVALIDAHCLRIVDVVDDEITFRTADDSRVIVHAAGCGLKICQHVIIEDEGEGIRQIHSRFRLHTLRLNLHNLGIVEHPCEVDAIHAEVE